MHVNLPDGPTEHNPGYLYTSLQQKSVSAGALYMNQFVAVMQRMREENPVFGLYAKRCVHQTAELVAIIAQETVDIKGRLKCVLTRCNRLAGGAFFPNAASFLC